MSPWKTSIPTQKIYLCLTTGNSHPHAHHAFYNGDRALAWKTKIEKIKEEMQTNTSKGNCDKVDELRQKLLKDFNLSYYDIPIVQEVALE